MNLLQEDKVWGGGLRVLFEPRRFWGHREVRDCSGLGLFLVASLYCLYLAPMMVQQWPINVFPLPKFSLQFSNIFGVLSVSSVVS